MQRDGMQVAMQPKSKWRSRAGGDFYEKYLRFGLVLGRLAILKNKYWTNYEHFLRAFSFLYFRGNKSVSIKYCSIRTKKLHKMKERKLYFFLRQKLLWNSL